jgi:hypothetical protein
VRRKRGRAGASWQNSPPFIPYLAHRQRQGGGQPRGASVRRPGGVLSGPTAARGRGKRRRRARAFHPRAHLRLERREAADRRRTEGGGGANGGGAVELGERLCDSSKEVWCGEGVVVAALNRRRGRFGGMRYFRRGHRRARAPSRSPAGLLQRPVMRWHGLLRSTLCRGVRQPPSAARGRRRSGRWCSPE